MKHSREYREYLCSDEWREKRRLALIAAAHRCEGCGSQDGLEVHHLNYRNLGRESLEDLQVMCRRCHPDADEVRRAEVWTFGQWAERKHGPNWERCGSIMVLHEQYNEWRESRQARTVHR